MTADTLRQIFDAIYLLMLGAWAGAAVLVLLLLPAAPPRSGKDLPDSDSQWIRHLLGRFYRLGATCGALAIPSALCARLAFPEYRTPWFAVQSLCLIGLTLPMFGGASRLSRTGQPEPASPLRSIRARLGFLIVLLAALAAFQALRPSPRTRGIIEPRPSARSASSPPSLPTTAGETPRDALH